MLKLSICAELFVQDQEFVDRIDSVAALDVSAFDFWGWMDKDIAAISARQKQHNLTVASMLLEPPSNMLVPNAAGPLIEAIRKTAPVARQLGCTRLITLVDDIVRGVGRRDSRYLTEQAWAQRQVQRAHLVYALRTAAPIAEAEGVTLLLEPLNTLVDHAGYFLVSSQDCFEIIEEVDSPAVRAVFDVYHQQISEGNLINNITGNIDKIGYLHIADVPGRHEPGTGEINFLNVLRAAARAGYDGYIGLELIPQQPAQEALVMISSIVDQINQEALVRSA